MIKKMKPGCTFELRLRGLEKLDLAQSGRAEDDKKRRVGGEMEGMGNGAKQRSKRAPSTPMSLEYVPLFCVLPKTLVTLTLSHEPVPTSRRRMRRKCGQSNKYVRMRVEPPCKQADSPSSPSDGAEGASHGTALTSSKENSY